jgi:hypothetical protein
MTSSDMAARAPLDGWGGDAAVQPAPLSLLLGAAVSLSSAPVVVISPLCRNVSLA